MSDPALLEDQADQLRSLVQQARSKASSLSSHLDRIVTSAQDDTLWRGPYPTESTGTLEDFKQNLVNAADLLNDDASAWEDRAGQLESEASQARAEQRREQRKSSSGDGPR